MEIAANTVDEREQYAPPTPSSMIGLTRKELIILIAVGIVFYYGGLRWDALIVEGAFAAAIFFSLFSVELNFAFFLCVFHLAASLNPRWIGTIENGRWVILGIFALKGLALLFSRREKKTSTTFQLLLFAYGIISLFSVIGAFIPKLSFQRTMSYWFFYFAVGSYLWNYSASREAIIRLVKITVFTGTAFLAFGLLTDSFKMAMSQGFAVRYGGVYPNPNMLGLAVIINTPLSAYLYFNKSEHRSAFSRFYYLSATVISVLSMLGSGSRASIGGLILGGMSVLVLHYRRRVFLVVTIALLFMGTVFSVIEKAVTSDYFSGIVVREDTLETMSGRSEIWDRAYEMFKRKPLIGWGFGTSEFVVSSGGEISALEINQKYALHVHSSFFRVLVETGILGTLIYLLLILITIRKIINMEKNCNSAQLHDLFLTMTAIFIAGLANSFMESWLFSIGSLITIMYWFFVSLIFAFNSRMDEFIEPGDKYRKPGFLLN